MWREALVDDFGLTRFLSAQDGVFESALAEIRQGRKKSHWMWFIFPQLVGLGDSAMARRYGIRSLAEAKAFLEHPVLGTRLCSAVAVLQDLVGSSAHDVFDALDALKLRSSLTLFAEAGGGPLFEAALARWFSAEKDPATLALLDRG